MRAARGLTTSEAGGQATFEVSLTSPALEPVDIPIASSDPAEGTASPASLRFTADNWQTPQTVTVTGVDDGAKDGDRLYTVTVGPSISQDKRYLGLSARRRWRWSTATTSPVSASKGPPSCSHLGVRRPARPSGWSSTAPPAPPCACALSSSDEGEGKVSPAELVFEPGNWNQPQTVTLTGIDDDERDGSQSYQVLTGAAVSADRPSTTGSTRPI